jgi:hypothetical protein
MARVWHIEALARAKKLPRLDKFLSDISPKKPQRAQTSQEVLAVFQSLVAKTAHLKKEE